LKTPEELEEEDRAAQAAVSFPFRVYSFSFFSDSYKETARTDKTRYSARPCGCTRADETYGGSGRFSSFAIFPDYL
jgi:hypothetical protein